MKLEDIEKEWAEDSKINIVDLSGESANIPNLHSKFYRIYIREGLLLEKLKADHSELTRNKVEYYRGDMDIAEIKQFGWSPLDKHILKADVPRYVETDKDIVASNLKIVGQKLKVEFLESIIKQIQTRNFILKNIIDYEKFKVGA